MAAATCFPEPPQPDPTPSRRTERTADWLARSTSIRAVACRRFYNRNLAALPSEAQAALCLALRRDRSMATHFEIVVGRFLQELGATKLHYQPLGTEGSRVDWTAEFPDGPASVEATAPVVNAVVGQETRHAGPFLDMLSELAPKGWHPILEHAPILAPGERRQWARYRLAAALAAAPQSEPGAQHQIVLDFANGALEVMLYGASDPDMQPADVSGPIVGYMDNTSEVVYRAIEKKRRQARGAVKPVLAALFTGGFGSYELDKFDIALFGRTVAHLGTSLVTFDPSGIFGGGRSEPTFAGALAFANLGWRGGPDPVLYVHPRFSGGLPRALLGLRRRVLTRAGIEDVLASRENLLHSLDWPIS